MLRGTGQETTLGGLPRALRSLLSAFLITIGLGYLSAITYLFLTEIDPHQKMGQSAVQAIEMKYRGSPSGSRLEAALTGAMADKASPQEKDQIVKWVRAGAPQSGYGAVKPIFDRNCVACHSASSGTPLPPLDTYQAVQALTATDTGESIARLARVSHIHLFGLSFIFLLTGAIFSLSRGDRAFKTIVVVLPFLSIWADIGSWWITHYVGFFAWVVLVGGAMMGLALAVQILVSLWQMWIPLEARSRDSRLRRQAAPARAS